MNEKTVSDERMGALGLKLKAHVSKISKERNNQTN
jgi:hypothetical protein